MMKSQVDAKELRQINEQAALWMLLKEDGPLTSAERRRHEAWLKLPYRAEALRQMEALNARVNQPWMRRRLSIRIDPRNSRSPAMVLG